MRKFSEGPALSIGPFQKVRLEGIYFYVVRKKWKAVIKVFGSSPAATYVQRWALCSYRPANVKVSAKRVEVVVRS